MCSRSAPARAHHRRSREQPAGAGTDGESLQAAGILYCPDYVINAGGIISVAREYHGGATEEQVIADIQGIPARLTEIFERAGVRDRTTNAVADEMARELLARQRHKLVA